MTGPMPSPAPGTSADGLREHVVANARTLGLSLDDARIDRVAAHLRRTAALAELLEAFDLGPEDEPAEVYCPSARRLDR